jgi:hypothetical protein
MDLALYLRVLWRFRIIVAAGFLMAVILTFLAVEKVSFAGGSPMFSPRKTPVYQSDAFLQVTGNNAPELRAKPKRVGGSATTPATDPFDPGRLSYLTTLYANLALNDITTRRLRLDPLKPEKGALTVTAVPAPAYANPAILNILDFQATGPTPERAMALANGGTRAFQSWLRRYQDEQGIEQDSRTVAVVYKQASPPVVVSHGGKTLPIIVFLTVFGATIGLALVLENVRPRPGGVRSADDDPRDLEEYHADEPERRQVVNGRRRSRRAAGRPRR